ncbi:MAG TPA: type III secretion inner membrane ring lipoprotein SctJ [Chlamydiales bacterium]|nr:type III secretion inner membrane ring lipoprotein SctJ [Chlamydiales bacterium]
MKKKLIYLLLIAPLFLLFTSCGETKSIVNDITEREANEIIVYLAAKGIAAQKIRSSGDTGPGTTEVLWNIFVDEDSQIKAMAVLNQAGLPKRKSTSLLTLFAKSGLMSTDKEETIRYQAGLEQELSSIIRKIDGVLDADVQISFPSSENLPLTGAEQEKIKAAVYVKHRGAFDNPNNHLNTKIKKLLAGSIEKLRFEDVAIITDRSSIDSAELDESMEMISSSGHTKEYVKIWSMVMTKKSATIFRVIFFIMTLLILAFGGLIGFLIYKFYPIIQKHLTEKKNNLPPPGEM